MGMKIDEILKVPGRRALLITAFAVTLSATLTVFQNCGFTTSSVDEFDVPEPVAEVGELVEDYKQGNAPVEELISSELPDFTVAEEPVTPTPRIAMTRAMTCVAPRQKLYCFGDNSRGQAASTQDGALLKNAAAAHLLNDPTYVNPDQSIESLSGGVNHLCARMSTNKLVCWGENDQKQLGRANTSSREPGYVDLTGLPETFAANDIVSGAGMSFTVSGGQVYCWGACAGFTASSSATVPTLLTATFPESVVSIAVRKDAAHPRLCAVLLSSKAMCVEPGGEPQYVPNPQAPEQPALGIRQVTVGPDFECFLVHDAVLCRGSNTLGALGTGTSRAFSDSLTLVYGLGKGQKIKLIASAGHTTCAVNEDQVIYCWGSNSHGALGAGQDCNEGDNRCYSEYPTTVTYSNRFKSQGLVVREIAGSEAMNGTEPNAVRFCIRFENTSVACWGQRYLGDDQEGYGDPANTYASRLKSVVFPGAPSWDSTAQESSDNFQAGPGPGTETARTSEALPTADNSAAVTFERKLARVQKMTCGFPDKKMYCWGAENQGFLGGSDNYKNRRTLVPTWADLLNDSAHLNSSQAFVSIFEANNAFCALMSNGKVRCWGSDKVEYKSPFGSGSGQIQASDIRVKSSEFWVILVNGGLRYWDGGTGTPNWVTGFQDTAAVKVTAIATQVGAGKVCARLDDGTAKCFSGSSGTTVRIKNPLDISQDLANVRQVVVGLNHQCFLVGDAVACMGKNDKGQLGSGNTVDSPDLPVIVKNLGAGSNVKLIAANGNTTCAVKINNEVYCWGSNQDGALGGGTNPDCGGSNSTAASCYLTTPQRVHTTETVPGDLSIEEIEILGAAADSSMTNDYRQVCIRLSNKGVSCWGGKYLGNDTLNASTKPVPARFNQPDGVPSTDPSPTASPSSTATYQAGSGVSDGSLGEGSSPATVPRGDGTTPSPLPIASRILINSSGRSGGVSVNCAVPDRRIYCWGNRSSGYSLGSSTYRDRTATTPIDADLLNHPDHLNDSQQFKQFSETDDSSAHMCLLLSNNRVRCWNYNEFFYFDSYWTISGVIDQITGSYGASWGWQKLLIDGGFMRVKLAANDADRRRVPAPAFMNNLPRGGNIAALGRGATLYGWSAAIMSDSTVKVVDADSGETTLDPPYAAVEDPENRGTALRGVRQAVHVGFQNYAYCLLVYDGVLCGGNNEYGQLGDGSTMNSVTFRAPVIPRGLSSGVKMLAGGGATFCAVKTDNRVYCWGRNSNGILGIGVNGNVCPDSGRNTTACRSLEPMLVSGTEQLQAAGRSITQLEVGARTACILLDNKTMKCWGAYPGDGSTASNVPVDVQFPAP